MPEFIDDLDTEATPRPKINTGMSISHDLVYRFGTVPVVTFHEHGKCTIGLNQWSGAGWMAILNALLTHAVATGTVDDTVPVTDTLHHLDMILAGKHSEKATPW